MYELSDITKSQNYIRDHKYKEAILTLSILMENKLKLIGLEKLDHKFLKENPINNYNFRFIILLMLEKNLIVDSILDEQVELNQMIRLSNKAKLNVDDLSEEEANFFLNSVLLLFHLNKIM